MNRKIRVLVVDDSAVVRQLATAALGSDADIEVLGAAPDPIFAQERLKKEWPDVFVLDVEMPRMDGLTFLGKIMDERPTPVVICSSLTSRGAETTVKALALGAVAFVTKPDGSGGDRRSLMSAMGIELVRAVKAAALARTARPRNAAPPRPGAGAAPRAAEHGAKGVIAIGASTGGPQALEQVLTALPADMPGMAIVQHMPETFTALFARRLDGLCAIHVREAESGDRLSRGLALIAPGGRHMAVRRDMGGYYVEVMEGPLVNRHRPSVDVLFRSVAQCAGADALGLIMTGMGDDGARGLKEMRAAGAYTLAQDEESSVVYGMPGAAVRIGAAEHSLGLEKLAGLLCAAARREGPAGGI